MIIIVMIIIMIMIMLIRNDHAWKKGLQEEIQLGGAQSFYYSTGWD